MSENRMNGRTYILLIENYKDREVFIGKLEKLRFVQGNYAYVGSAKKNLMARIKRHLSNNKKKFWHIDYFLDRKTRIKEVWISPRQAECRMAKYLFKKGFQYIKNFGSSDCRCRSHLFFIEKKLVSFKNFLKKNGFKNVTVIFS
uniref:GIY-YIG nuclease family protein n=1 Tax=candidate division WOR-3 bacterium TaxID=2052148 RepID=A0A7V0Z7V5_UNCW3